MSRRKRRVSRVSGSWPVRLPKGASLCLYTYFHQTSMTEAILLSSERRALGSPEGFARESSIAVWGYEYGNPIGCTSMHLDIVSTSVVD